MDPSDTQPHIIRDIAEVKSEIHSEVEVDLNGLGDVSSLPSVTPTHPSEDTTSDLPFSMQILLGTSSLAFVAFMLVFRVFQPWVSPEAEAGRLRQMPEVVCHGSTCMTPMSSSSSSAHAIVRRSSSSSSAAAVVEESSSSSTENSFNPFRKFHAAPPEDPTVVKLPRADNVQGIYLGASNVKRTDFLDDMIEKLKASGGNAMVFDVKGGYVFFDGDMPKARALGLIKPLYDLPEIVKKLRDNGIYSIGRFVSVKDYELTARLPETSIKNPKTGVTIVEDWVDPANEKALEINYEYACAVAASDIDELNADYIRFSTAAPYALSVFSAEEKADHVEKFVEMLRNAIDTCGHGKTRLGLSTYAILGWNYEVNLKTLGQDVVRFGKIVDVISPMAYPATFTSEGYYVPGKHPGPRDYWLVYRTLTGYYDLLKAYVKNDTLDERHAAAGVVDSVVEKDDHEVIIRPWIQGYYVDSEDVRQQIRAVYDAGFCGFQFWNANNNYGPVFSGMKSAPKAPERCL